jgi:PIN domain nuclease of toxin-antitoxin system
VAKLVPFDDQPKRRGLGSAKSEFTVPEVSMILYRKRSRLSFANKGAFRRSQFLVWAIPDDGRLSRRAQQTFTVAPNELCLGVANRWEILTKEKTGRLPLPEPSGPCLVKNLGENRIEMLPIKLAHVLRIETLAVHRRDPFDRTRLRRALRRSFL